VVIFRDPAVTQGTDYTPNDPFPAESHEQALDRLTMICQRLKQRLDRAAVLDDGLTGVVMELPAPEASKVIGWTADADGLQNYDPADFATVLTYADWRTDLFDGDGVETTFTLSATPGNVNNTDVSVDGTSMRPGSDYSLGPDGLEIVFAVAPAAGTDNVCVRYGQASPQELLTDFMETIWIPAGAMTARTTNGAAFGSTELATNDIMLSTLDFDKTTSEAAQFSIGMPASWNEGTVSFQPIWSHASGATAYGVIFGMRCRYVNNGDALDQAFGTGQTSSDTGGTADTEYVGPVSSAITPAGTATTGARLSCEVYRDISDTLDVDARLTGVKVFFRRNSQDDSA
jgi:hypothetical protein